MSTQTSASHPFDENQQITIVTSDKRHFTVPLSLMKSSLVFKSMLEGADFDAGTEVALQEVNGPQFERVLEWCRHHEGQPPINIEVDPHTRERRWFTFSEFHRRFFQMPMEELEELIMAANYLDIQSLYLYGCQAAAGQLKGKSPEEIRSLLGLPDDLTDEEKAAIRRENVWCSYH